MSIVQDIDRPDVNGTPPRMQTIADNARKALMTAERPAPVINVATDDNLCSSVYVTGSMDPREDWANGIFENSRYFRFSIMPVGGKRYYNLGDQVRVEMPSIGYKFRQAGIKAMRASTTTPDKAIARIVKWIKAAS